MAQISPIEMELNCVVKPRQKAVSAGKFPIRCEHTLRDAAPSRFSTLFSISCCTLGFFGRMRFLNIYVELTKVSCIHMYCWLTPRKYNMCPLKAVPKIANYLHLLCAPLNMSIGFIFLISESSAYFKQSFDRLPLYMPDCHSPFSHRGFWLKDLVNGSSKYLQRCMWCQNSRLWSTSRPWG